MKILFLDFDGVMNSAAWFKKLTESRKKGESFLTRHSDELDPDCVDRVKYIVDQTSAKVVISSSWRILHTDAELKDILRLHEWDCPIIGHTPKRLPGGSSFRGDEVDFWLTTTDAEGVTKFICLDDNSDFHPHNNLLQTSWDTGITDEDAFNAIAFLKGDIEKPVSNPNAKAEWYEE